jgi:hypothetical protein
MMDGSCVATERPGKRFVAAAAEADVASAHGDVRGVPALETRGGVMNVASNLQANHSVNSIQRAKEQKWG